MSTSTLQSFLEIILEFLLQKIIEVSIYDCGDETTEGVVMSNISGWLTIKQAVKKYGLDYDLLRNAVILGIFTRGDFIEGRNNPIFLRIVELDAYKAGGAAAALKLKQEFELASQTTKES
jgi:hypothetical protein